MQEKRENKKKVTISLDNELLRRLNTELSRKRLKELDRGQSISSFSSFINHLLIERYEG